MPCSQMITVISLLPAIICQRLLCMHVCVCVCYRVREGDSREREKRKKAGKWGSLNKSGKGAAELQAQLTVTPRVNPNTSPM